MSVAQAIPVEVYLSTVYRPDCDFIDGRIEGRNLGEREHATLQSIFLNLFFERRREWNIAALTEQRVQISRTRFRIPDVSVLRRSDPMESIVLRAPLICIEVLSPEDTFRKMQERVDDYLEMGVEHVWCIDPVSRHAYVATSTGYEIPANGVFTVPGTPIRIELTHLFQLFDEELAGL